MVAQAGLCLAWLETPEDTICHVVAHVYSKREIGKELRITGILVSHQYQPTTCIGKKITEMQRRSHDQSQSVHKCSTWFYCWKILCKAKQKYMCVSGFIPRKNRVGRSDLIFIFFLKFY